MGTCASGGRYHWCIPSQEKHVRKSSFLILTAVVIAGCSGGSNVTGTGGGGGGSGGGTCTSTSGVAVCDDHFNPTTTMINAGGSVTWTWMGKNQHDVTFTGGPALVGTATGLMVSGSFTQKFNTSGTYTYVCTNHPGMTGTVTVN